MSPESIDQAIAVAVHHYQSGNFPQAEAICRQILNDTPNHAITLNLLGLLTSQTGRSEEAIKFIRQAIEIAPNVAPFHGNLGNALSYLGRYGLAIAAYSRAIQLNPNDAESHGNLGIALAETGDIAAAIAADRKAISLDPNSPVAYNNLGVALKKAGKPEEAIRAYQQALKINPQYIEALNNLGDALCDSGQIDEGIATFLRVIELDPQHAIAYNNLGTALKQAGRFADAIVAFNKSIQLQPNLVEPHCNLGVAQADSGLLQEGIVSLRRAIELNPNYAQAHINLGVVLCNVGQAKESIIVCERAIELEPDLEQAHCNFAHVLLTQGDFDRGWPEYEHRWKANPRIRSIPFPQPRWHGESFNGRTLLIHAEQGFGDAIHFIRYIPLVVSRGGKVILECQPELVQLFQQIAGVDKIVPTGQPLPSFDLHCPLMSLPLVFGTTLQSIPAQVPYLSAQKSFASTGMNVGLVWAGRPTHSNDQNRSMKLSDFEPLAIIPGITFHTLQKGSAAAEALSPPTGMNPVNHSAELHDFVDTARLISALDLVISVDTSVAHLAGALGKPVWVLLPLVADWRWMRDRSDSPWYPTMRLFRQSRWGSWEEPVLRVAEFLSERPPHAGFGGTPTTRIPLTDQSENTVQQQ